MSEPKELVRVLLLACCVGSRRLPPRRVALRQGLGLRVAEQRSRHVTVSETLETQNSGRRGHMHAGPTYQQCHGVLTRASNQIGGSVIGTWLPFA